MTALLEHPPAADPKPGSTVRPGARGNRGTVLVVVSNADERIDLYSALDRRGLLVATSKTGIEALKYATWRCPSVVVMDWGLEDLRGPVMVDFLRTISSEVPIVAMADPGARDLEKAGTELSAVLEKPVNATNVVRAVDSILSRRLHGKEENDE